MAKVLDLGLYVTEFKLCLNYQRHFFDKNPWDVNPSNGLNSIGFYKDRFGIK